MYHHRLSQLDNFAATLRRVSQGQQSAGNPPDAKVHKGRHELLVDYIVLKELVFNPRTVENVHFDIVCILSLYIYIIKANKEKCIIKGMN